MSSPTVEASSKDSGHHRTINLNVTYTAAAKPYHEPEAPFDETLAAVKANALNAFHLTEGPLPDGRVRTFKLFHGRDELLDLSKTVGELAGHAEALDLKLTEYIVQGMP